MWGWDRFGVAEIQAVARGCDRRFGDLDRCVWVNEKVERFYLRGREMGLVRVKRVRRW